MDLVTAAKQHIQEIDLDDARIMVDHALIMDVREPSEYATGRLPNAVNIPRGLLEFQISNHPAFAGKQGREILVYCQSGGRSALAVETLQKLGYTKPMSLAGGYKAWNDAGLPTEA